MEWAFGFAGERGGSQKKGRGQSPAWRNGGRSSPRGKKLSSKGKEERKKSGQEEAAVRGRGRRCAHQLTEKGTGGRYWGRKELLKDSITENRSSWRGEGVRWDGGARQMGRDAL